jgi:hypothetical protein
MLTPLWACAQPAAAARSPAPAPMIQRSMVFSSMMFLEEAERILGTAIDQNKTYLSIRKYPKN